MPATGVQFDLPSNFHQVPTQDRSAFDRWCSDQLATATHGTAGSSLARDLRWLAREVNPGGPSDRTVLVVTPEAPNHEGIAALGLLTVQSPGGTSVSDLRAVVEAVEGQTSPSTLTRRVVSQQLGTREVVLVHLLQGAPSAGAVPRLVERCSALMLDVDNDLVVRLDLTAFDLALFEDIVATSLMLLESVGVAAA